MVDQMYVEKLVSTSRRDSLDLPKYPIVFVSGAGQTGTVSVPEFLFP